MCIFCLKKESCEKLSLLQGWRREREIFLQRTSQAFFSRWMEKLLSPDRIAIREL